MKTQHKIKRQLTQPESITVIRRILENNPTLSRTEISKQVCEHFSFYDALNRPQWAGCLKALRELDDAGHIPLPVSRNTAPRKTPKRHGEPVSSPHEVPSSAGQVRGLCLQLVKSDEQFQIWNRLMHHEHPQGGGPLVGVQVRYLIASEHGWLGGFGFSASALQLRDRDRWIGWDASKRRDQLHRLIGMSRFLIRPMVNCRNLASRVLGMTLRRLADDVERDYGYRPWLVESFVDIEHYRGTCYQATNWIEVGRTQGRGRQDRYTQRTQTVKAIYLYPLSRDFRTRLGVGPAPEEKRRKVAEGVDEESWAQQEFGGAVLGDERLSKRLVESATIQARTPGRAFCGAAQGESSIVKGYYRMIDRPDDDAVTMEAILAPHRQRTIERMRAQSTVLCIQDGTDLNYSAMTQCEGLGDIGKNQTGAVSRGLHLHSTFVTTTDGLPIGILRAQCSAPPSIDKAQKPARARPIEEKKSFVWLQGVADSVALARQLPNTRQICVMDREADFYELFAQPRHKRVELLVRAKYNRCTKMGDKLFDAVRNSTARCKLQIQIPRQSARPKRSKQKARPRRAQRQAQVEVRYQATHLNPPAHHKGKDPLSLTIIHLLETTPPPNEQPVEWFLLTTLKVTDEQAALQCIHWYTLRWRIEDFHRVLKSGCRVKKMRHKTAERLKRAIAIKLVIAWRIMLMTLLGRTCPTLPAEVLFSDLEIELLRMYAVTKKLPLPDKLGQAVLLVARLGGYLGRKHDPSPGHQLLWHGYEYLQKMADGYLLGCQSRKTDVIYG